MDLERIQAFVSGKHENIEGWFFPLDQITFFELVSLQNRLGISGDFCEIGVFQGKSLVFLSLLKSGNEKLFGFDLFDGDTKKITQENLAQEGSTENVSLQKGLTSEIHKRHWSFSERIARFRTDAGEYHEVLDSQNCLRRFCLIGHYCNGRLSGPSPGIEAAVLDFAERDRPRRSFLF